MAAAAVSAPLVSLALPDDARGRLLVQALLVVAGTLLLTLAAKTTVPFWPVPATLQTLAVFVIGATYGRNLAVATVLLYLAEGAAGLPVFATGAGIAYMAGPTGGYLVGFVVAAAFVGWAADLGFARSPLKLFAAVLVAEVAILALGAAWLVYLFGLEKAVEYGVGPFIATDLIKAAIASAVVPAVWALLPKRG